MVRPPAARAAVTLSQFPSVSRRAHSRSSEGAAVEVKALGYFGVGVGGFEKYPADIGG
jgi:hypothetical protein